MFILHHASDLPVFIFLFSEGRGELFDQKEISDRMTKKRGENLKCLDNRANSLKSFLGNWIWKFTISRDRVSAGNFFKGT